MIEHPHTELTCEQLVELITDYLEDGMPSHRRLRFEEHLAFCAACAAYVDQIRQTIQLIGTFREDDLDPAARAEMLRVFGECGG